MPQKAATDPLVKSRNLHEHFLLSFDGTPIHYWLWPAHKNPQPTNPSPVLIVHGAGEYAGRYLEFAQFLNQSGFDVAALDLRGFGSSGGPRAFADSFDDYVRDIEAVAAQLLLTTESKKIHLLGHSMGGLIAATAAAEHRPAGLTSLTLSSPCMGLSFAVPAHLKAIGAVLSHLRPHKLFTTKAISELLTHDAQIASLHRTDPQITHFMSARIFSEMARTMSRHLELARRIDVPVGVFQAGDDRVVDVRASRAFFEALTHPRKHWALYPGLFHEILNETSRSDTHRDVLAFLTAC